MADPSTSRAAPQGGSARLGALVFTGISIVLAATGGWLVWRMLAVGGYDREALRPVVVVARPVGAGRPFQAEDLVVKMWPVSSAPATGYADPAVLLKPTPAVPTAGFVAGEPVLKERLASPEAGPGLAAMVGNELRAVTVQVDRAMAASRLLYPGAHVDVLVTIEDRMRSMVATMTVLEDVRVLAIGTFADIDAARRGQDPAKVATDAEAVVTVEVTPGDAEKLALSARQGKLDLALRNATDRSHTPTTGIAVGELMRSQMPEGEGLVGSTTGAAAAAEKPSKRASGSNPPVIRSSPRPRGGDQKPSGATIEVLSVPTQSR